MNTYDRDSAMPPLPDIRMIREGRIWRVDPQIVPQLMQLEPMVRHAVHHRICQNVYQQTKERPPEPADRTFIDKGVVTLPNRIPATLAANLSAFATEILRATGQARGLPTNYVHGFRVDDANTTIAVPQDMHSVFLDLLPSIIDANVEATIESYLGSYFRLDHCALYRTQRTEEPLVSFRWHRDVASMGQIHIMLYLTPSGDDSGATDFIPISDTRRLAETGYAFVKIDQRVLDLDAGAGGGEPPEIVRPRLDAGDAVMFGASRVLHRGVQPRRGFRDVFLVVLLPATVPWRIELEELGRDRLMISSDKEAYMSNPFVAFNPTHRDYAGGFVHGTMVPPRWSALGHFWPP